MYACVYVCAVMDQHVEARKKMSFCIAVNLSPLRQILNLKLPFSFGYNGDQQAAGVCTPTLILQECVAMSSFVVKCSCKCHYPQSHLPAREAPSFVKCK